MFSLLRSKCYAMLPSTGHTHAYIWICMPTCSMNYITFNLVDAFSLK